VEVGVVIDGRYRLDAVVGCGGFGSVFRASDLATSEDVAVKVLTRPAPRLVDRMLQEISVLRRLDLPGVVDFLDEGLWGDHPYVVMPLARGTPFPGPCDDRSWASLGPRAVALAETIARVHAVGVLHRDLKPDNVLWVDGCPLLIDFGLAVSDALVLRDEGVSGTPAYMAPEQYDGVEPTERSDLFSLGAILYEVFAGARPFSGSTFLEVAWSVLMKGAAPLASVADVPAPVGALVDQLLRVDPEERPARAEDVVQRLVACLPAPRVSVVRATHAAQLEAHFAGPELVHHLRSDAARVLWARTAGAPEAVARTLQSWHRAGVCSPRGERWLMRRDALDRLLAGMRVDPCRGLLGAEVAVTREQEDAWVAVDLLAPWSTLERIAALCGRAPDATATDLEALADMGLVFDAGEGWRAARAAPRRSRAELRRHHDRAARLVPADADARIHHLLAADRREEVPEACLVVGEARLAEGRLPQAWAIAREGMVVERRLGSTRPDLVMLAADVALRGAATGWLAEVALEARRRRRDDIATFLDAAQTMLHDRGAGAQLDQLVVPPRLEPWRLRLQAHGMDAAPVETHAIWLAQVRAVATSLADGAALWTSWHSRFLSRVGRFREAAALMEGALDGLSDPNLRVARGLDLCGAWCDAGEDDRAEALLDVIEPLVLRQRSPFHETKALHLRMSLAYHRGEASPVDGEEVEEALALMRSELLASPVRLTLAAAAWRRGDRETSLRNALASADAWVPEQQWIFWGLPRMLSLLVGGPPLESREHPRLLAGLEGGQPRPWS
jgi:hypothetical protein